MRLNQILTEQQQQELEMLQEGPLGSLAKAAGRGVGNVIGGVAKAAGAVKGAVKGAVDRAKSSFAAGEKGAYSALSGKPDADDGNTGSTGGGTTPAAQPTGGAPKAQPAAAAEPDDQTAKPAAAPAPAAKPAAKPAAEPTAGAATGDQPAANDSAYAQAQKAVDGLAPEQKKEIVAMLQADPKVKAAMAKPAAKKPAATTQPAANAEQPAAGAEQPAAASNKPAAATQPAAQSTDLQPQTTTGRTQGGGKVAGQLSNSPSAVKRREKRAAKKGATTYTDTVQQKRLTPGGFSQMVTGLTKQNSSIERTGTIIRENFSFFRKR